MKTFPFLKLRLLPFALILCLSASAQVPVGQDTHKIDDSGPRLCEFVFEDQFEKQYQSDDFRKPVLVLVCADRVGSRYSGLWGDLVRNGLSEAQLANVDMVGVATLGGFPGFLKGFIKSKFPKDPADWTLLDWKNLLGKTYGFQEDSCNVLVFNRERILVHQDAGTEPGEEQREQLLERIRNSLPCMNIELPPHP